MSKRVELDLDPSNPSPFKPPFLVLEFGKEVGGRCDWVIDVDGEIDLYLKDFSLVRKAHAVLAKSLKLEELESIGIPNIIAGSVNWRNQATPLLERIIATFGSHGLDIVTVDGYSGSAGPSHILRNGAFFQRIHSLEQLTVASPTRTQLPDISKYIPRILNHPRILDHD